MKMICKCVLQARAHNDNKDLIIISEDDFEHKKFKMPK